MNATVRTRLKAVVPKAAEPSKPKMLIYGAPGVGKTWGALDFPGVYYIDTEGGADLAHYTAKLDAAGGVYLGPDQGAQSFDTIIDQVDALAWMTTLVVGRQAPRKQQAKPMKSWTLAGAAARNSLLTALARARRLARPPSEVPSGR